MFTWHACVLCEVGLLFAEAKCITWPSGDIGKQSTLMTKEISMYRYSTYHGIPAPGLGFAGSLRNATDPGVSGVS